MYALQGVGDCQNKDTEGLSIDSLMLTALPQDYQYPVDTGVPQSGLKLWLKADAGVGADSNHHVSEWVNQAGGDKNAVQADTEHMPLLVQDAANNKPVLRFANHASSDINTTDQQASFMTSTGFATENMSSYSVAFQIKPITLADYNQGINANQGTFIFHSNAAGGALSVSIQIIALTLMKTQAIMDHLPSADGIELYLHFKGI